MRKIPDPIKRKLRQEANFGCCECGTPILEYHHIIPWHEVKKHNIEDMMVLCPTCHHSIDSYSLEIQRKIKADPFNHQNENSPGTLIVSQGICAIDTGIIMLLGDGPVITSGNTSYLEFYVTEDDILEISMLLFDQTGNSLLEISKSEWMQGDISCWDVEFISASKTLIVRESKGTISLKVDAKNFPVRVEGSFWVQGNLLSFNKKGISLNKKISIKKNMTATDKFGVWHFEEDAWPLHLGKAQNGKVGPCDLTKKNYTNSGSFSGGDYYSGGSIRRLWNYLTTRSLFSRETRLSLAFFSYSSKNESNLELYLAQRSFKILLA